MIGLWTGVPRSGKTYSLVYRIATMYCVKFGDTYELKPEYILITDIDGLLIDHYPLEDFLRSEPSPGDDSSDEPAEQIPVCVKCGKSMILKSGPYGNFYSCTGFPQCKSTLPSRRKSVSSGSGPSGFDIKNLFSDSGLKRLRDRFPDKKIVIVVDECQRYFHNRFFDRDVFYAFEYHGHYGVDIYLISHHISKISRDIVNCLEFETRLVPRRFGVPGFFWYLEKQGNKVVGRGKIPVRKNIFSLYKSQHFDQGDKVGKPFHKLFLIALSVALLGFYLFYSRVSSRLKPVNEVSEKSVESFVQKPVEKIVESSSEKFVEKKFESADKSKKSSSFFSSPEGYTYKPVNFFVLDGKIFIPYSGSFVPLALYPKKTLVFYRSGRPNVYELVSDSEPVRSVPVSDYNIARGG